MCVIALALLCGCGKKQNERSQEETTASSNVSEVSFVKAAEGQTPDFSWKDADGKTLSLSTLRGKVVLINFWATWCGPCKRELPDLIELDREYAPKGVKIVGISTDRGPNVFNDVRSFVLDHHIPYQIVISNSDLDEAFGNISAIPTSFFIDRQGKIAQSVVGMRPKNYFSETLNTLLTK